MQATGGSANRVGCGSFLADRSDSNAKPCRIVQLHPLGPKVAPNSSTMHILLQPDRHFLASQTAHFWIVSSLQFRPKSQFLARHSGYTVFLNWLFHLPLILFPTPEIRHELQAPGTPTLDQRRGWRVCAVDTLGFYPGILPWDIWDFTLGWPIFRQSHLKMVFFPQHLGCVLELSSCGGRVLGTVTAFRAGPQEKVFVRPGLGLVSGYSLEHGLFIVDLPVKLVIFHSYIGLLDSN